MKYNKQLETFNFQAFFERRRRNRENGIKRKVDRMMEEAKINAELSEEMDRRKRQWYNSARTYEQFRREDMMKAETVDKIIAELSKEMDTRKRQWYDLARTYEQFRREDTVIEMYGEYRCTSLHSRRFLTKTRRYIDRGRHLEKQRKRLRGRGGGRGEGQKPVGRTVNKSCLDSSVVTASFCSDRNLSDIPNPARAERAFPG